MGQVMNIGVGSFGVNTSGPIWQQMIKQHKISNQVQEQCQPIGNYQKFFHQSNTILNSKRIFKPRCVLTDLDPVTIDDFRYQNKNLNCFFNNQNLISGKEQGCFYTRSFFTQGKYICDLVLDQVRRQLEKCDLCSGINTIYSLNGASGGYADLLIQRLSIQYPKIPIHNNCLTASPNFNNGITQIYDQLLCLHGNIQVKKASTTFFDNEAIYKLLQQGPQHKNEQIDFCQVNKVIAKQINFATYGIRFNCSMPSSIKQIHTNLMPFNRIRYLSASLNRPICQDEDYCIDSAINSKRDIFQTVQYLYSCQKLLNSIDFTNGKFISSMVLSKNTQNYQILRLAINKFIKNSSIIRFCLQKQAFKIGTTEFSMHPIKLALNQQLTTLSGHTSIKNTFKRLIARYQPMYARRAFIHWYVGQGLSDGFFSEATEDIYSLIRDYEQLQYLDVDVSI